jgi:hypothetical protein
MGLGVEHYKGISHLGVINKVDGAVLHLNVKGAIYLL